MASMVEICNRALQKLGAKRITSLTDDSVNARACSAAYPTVKEAELRANDWNFAIVRVILAADATPPPFGKAYSYTLPADYLKLLSPDPSQNFDDLDWTIEGRKILTDDVAPLNVRYIFNVQNAAEMDPLFREALSSRLALELCEELTQSNTKRNALQQEYINNVRDARKRNAIEKRPAEAPDSSWLSKRY